MTTPERNGTTPRGYQVECQECHRRTFTATNPLKGGWPKCCGYTMRLVETERFIEAVNGLVNEIVGATTEALRGI